MILQKLTPILLLILSNLFMTFAWYGHLKNLKDKPLYIAILVSWGIAFLEYCFQVPANRIGSDYFTVSQLKIIQEIITMTAFAIFAVYYLKAPITRNYFYASLCMLAAAYFIFKDSTNA